MSEDKSKVVKELRRNVNRAVPPQLRGAAGKKIAKKVGQELSEEQRSHGPLTPVKGNIADVKLEPHDPTIRRRHVGREALSMIARRALVGLTKLKESRELVIYDTAPVPNAEYMLTPLSLLKNPNGTADLLVTMVSSEVLITANQTIAATSTEAGPSSPKLSIENIARYMSIQNLGSDPIYVCINGEYDPVKEELTKDTTPADGTGILLQGSGTLTVAHMIKANPRLISPSGNQVVNMWIAR